MGEGIGMRLLVGGMAILAAVFLMGTNKLSIFQQGMGVAKPLTLVDIQQAGGFEALSGAQKSWVRRRYAHDLAGLKQVCAYRLQVAQMHGEVRPARDLLTILALLDEALVRVADQNADPTFEQTLINDVIRALNR